MRKTLLDISKQVCGELSFQVPTNLMTSSDLLFQQVRFLISSACEELLSEHDWQCLKKVHTIELTGAESYTLPTDLDRILPGTFTYTSGMVAGSDVSGSVSDMTFQNLVNPTTATTSNYLTFQVYGDRLHIYPSTTTGGQLRFVYITNNIIQENAGDFWKNTFTQDADIPMFSSRLVVAFTKMKLLQAKGLDTSAATQEFNTQLELAKQRDVPAPIISFDGEDTKRQLPYKVVQL